MLRLYENIKKRRLALGMTQTDLAHALGYADKSMIAKIEAGHVDLSISKIHAFAKELHTTPSDLMGEVDNMETADTELKALLFGNIDSPDEMLDDVKRYAEFVKERSGSK